MVIDLSDRDTEEFAYELDGDSVEVKADGETKQLFVVKEASAEELRFKIGGDFNVDAQFKGATLVFKRITKEAFEDARK